MTKEIRDALREAQRKQPDWLILDTEGSIRGAMNFTTMRLDLILTPLASSAIEAIQAIKASEFVAPSSEAGVASRLPRCPLTRAPAALRPRSLKQVVEQLRESDIGILPTALIEKEAFRMLFSVGGGFAELERSGVSGVPAARANAQGYLAAVLELLESAKTQAA